ncbi:MAG: hypothetical protein WA971_01020 [Microbacterium sp.]
MVNAERLAVNEVSNLISRCPRLEDFIDYNDRTPVTDGNIDLYSGANHTVKTLIGRVAVQVKGSASPRKLKEKRPTARFSVEREVLEFFRTNGGGLYFYVPMRPDGTRATAYYCVLMPFKISRILGRMKPNQKTISIELSRMPADTAKIERIVELAIASQKQDKTTGFDERHLKEAKGFTIHSIVDIAEDRPTAFELDKTDFTVTLHTASGMSYAVDMDLTVYPRSYVPQEVDLVVSCGDVVFTQATIRQTAPMEIEFQLSEGLRLLLKDGADSISANFNVTDVGDLRSQVKNLDFLLAASRGAPLVVAERSHVLTSTASADFAEITRHRDRMAKIVELFDAFGLDDDITRTIDITEGDVTKLIALHKGIVLGEEVGGTTDGFGRYDFNIGQFKIMTVVAPGSTSSVTKLIDPFDPDKRTQFRIYRIAEDNSTEEIKRWGTVYEATRPDDLAMMLNLRLQSIVQAYEGLEDQVGARASANQMVLYLLKAADSVRGAHQTYLLGGAAALSDWLIEQGGDTLIYKINRWQVERRQGALPIETLKEIRRARHSLGDTEDRELRNACLTILLDERDELELIIEGLPPSEIEKLQSWPIWALTAESTDADNVASQD